MPAEAPAAARWRKLLTARAIPPGIRAAAPEDPYEVDLARRHLCLPRDRAEDVARALDDLPQRPREFVTISWDRAPRRVAPRPLPGLSGWPARTRADVPGSVGSSG